MYRYLNCIIFIIISILSSFGQKNTNGIPENVFLSVDRDLYVSGEWLYFDLFLTNNQSAGFLNSSKYAYIVVRNSRNEHISDNMIEISGSSTHGAIYIPDSLSTGIYQIVAFTNYLRNYSEDAFFTKCVLVVNRYDINLGFIDNLKKQTISDHTKVISPISSNICVSINKADFARREKVKIGIKIPNQNAIVSVSIKRKTPVTITNIASDTSSYSVLGKCKYACEFDGEIIQGRVLNAENAPLTKIPVYLSTPDSIPNLLYSITDANGYFQFCLNPFYNGKPLIIKVEVPKAKIVIDDKFVLHTPFRNPFIKMDGDLKAYISQLQIMVNIQKSLNQSFKTDISNNVSLGYRPLVYSKPQSVVYPPDYAYLSDFSEISREILPFLKVRLKNNEYFAEMVDLQREIYVKPFIFLDGVLIDDIQQIIQLDSKRIYKIESIPLSRYFGAIHMPGILSVSTFKKEIQLIKWILPTITIQDIPKLPYSVYSSNNIENLNIHIPDFRQLLYWEPSLKVSNTEEKNIEFTTSDCTGNFEIIMNGITKDGKILEYRNEFNVTTNSTIR
jgi:hypothetical protein